MEQLQSPGSVQRVAEDGFAACDVAGGDQAEGTYDGAVPGVVVLTSHIGDLDGGRVGWMAMERGKVGVLPDSRTQALLRGLV